MKNLLNNTIACAIVMTTCFNCSVESLDNEQFEESIIIEESSSAEDFATPNSLECDNEDPVARITNNGTIPITLQIAAIDGTILHTVQDLAPGNVSGYLSFAPSNIIFNVVKNTTGLSDEKVVHDMNSCMSFDIEVGSDNSLNLTVPVNL